MFFSYILITLYRWSNFCVLITTIQILHNVIWFSFFLIFLPLTKKLMWFAWKIIDKYFIKDNKGSHCFRKYCRQFLFRHKDIGSYKAETAARFIKSRIPSCNIVAHNCEVQSKNETFFQKFHMVICGLDSIVARRWINGMLLSLLTYNDGELNESTVIPLIDGGTEGFKGNVRVILPGMNPCIECTLDLYPPQVRTIYNIYFQDSILSTRVACVIY